MLLYQLKITVLRVSDLFEQIMEIQSKKKKKKKNDGKIGYSRIFFEKEKNSKTIYTDWARVLSS